MVAPGRDQRDEPRYGLASRGGHRDAERGDFPLCGVEPAPVGDGFFEQPVPVAQSALQPVGARAMLGVYAERKPIEKTATIARRARKEPIHRRREPEHSDMIGEGARRTGRHAVNAIKPLP